MKDKQQPVNRDAFILPPSPFILAFQSPAAASGRKEGEMVIW
jgi:hypothetical protein